MAYGTDGEKDRRTGKTPMRPTGQPNSNNISQSTSQQTRSNTDSHATQNQVSSQLTSNISALLQDHAENTHFSLSPSGCESLW